MNRIRRLRICRWQSGYHTFCSGHGPDGIRYGAATPRRLGAGDAPAPALEGSQEDAPQEDVQRLLTVGRVATLTWREWNA